MAQFLKEEIKKKIKQSAIEVFTKRGYKGTSIKAIADNANVSVGNVYRYYKNKEELYEAVISGVYNGVQNLLTEDLEFQDYKNPFSNVEIGNYREKMYIPLNKFIELYKSEHDIFVMILNGEKNSHYEKTILKFIDILKEFFYKFRDGDSNKNNLSNIEISALTNAIVFGTIDLLNHLSDEEINLQLMEFITDLIEGYFYAKHAREERL